MSDASTPRIVGNRDSLPAGPVPVGAWQPPTVAEVAARPPLPAPPPRPRPVAPPAPQNTARPAPPTTTAEPEKRPRPMPAWIEADSVLARVWERPEMAAGVIRSIERQEESEPSDGDELTPMQRIGTIMVALGQEVAGEVMKYLSDYDIEEATAAVARLVTVSAEMQERVLADLERDMASGRWLDAGGPDFARGVLERAVGPRKAREILDRVVGLAGGFQAMKHVSPDQVAPYLSQEHPQTIALILSQIEPQKAAGILDQFTPRLQADVSYRLATLDKVTPQAMKEVDEALKHQLGEFVGGDLGVGGPKVLADILNLCSSAAERNILDQFDAEDPDVAETVRGMMFVFADLEKLDDAALAIVVQATDAQELAISLKAISEPMKDRIQRIVSENEWKSLAARMEEIGPMRLVDVEQYQQRIVMRVRELEKEGRLTIIRGESDDHWV